MFFFYKFVEISDRMIEISINFTIRLWLLAIELFVIFIENMRYSNFRSVYFQKIRNLLVSYNDVAILFWRWQILIFIEFMFGLFWIYFRVLCTKSIEKRWLCVWLLSALNFLRDVWSNNVLVFLDQVEKIFSLFHWTYDMWRIKEIVDMMKYISILIWLLLDLNILTLFQLVA